MADFIGNVLSNAGAAARGRFAQDMNRTGQIIARQESNAVGRALEGALGLPPNPRYQGAYGAYGAGYAGYQGIPVYGTPVYDVRPRDARDGGIPFGYNVPQQSMNQVQQQPDEIKAAQSKYEANLAATQAAYYQKLKELSEGRAPSVVAAPVAASIPPPPPMARPPVEATPPPTTTRAPVVAAPVAASVPPPPTARAPVEATPPTIQAPVTAVAAAPTKAATATTAASASPVHYLAVQQQQAYLKVLGFDTGALDGIKASKTEAALAVFAAKMGISSKDTAGINKALVDQIEHSPKAKEFMDAIRANPNAASLDDRKAAQWVLKEQQDVKMPKSEHHGKMDGEFGRETKALLKKPYDYYSVSEKQPVVAAAAPAAVVEPIAVAPVVAAPVAVAAVVEPVAAAPVAPVVAAPVAVAPEETKVAFSAFMAPTLDVDKDKQAPLAEVVLPKSTKGFVEWDAPMPVAGKNDSRPVEIALNPSSLTVENLSPAPVASTPAAGALSSKLSEKLVSNKADISKPADGSPEAIKNAFDRWFEASQKSAEVLAAIREGHKPKQLDASPTAKELTEQAKIDPKQYTAMRDGGDGVSLSNKLDVAAVKPIEKPKAPQKPLAEMGM